MEFLDARANEGLRDRRGGMGGGGGDSAVVFLLYFSLTNYDNTEASS